MTKNIKIIWYFSSDTEKVDAKYKIFRGSGQFSIGRQPDNHICLDDTAVSRHHASISVSDFGIEIRDHNSSNGTRLEGYPITSQEWTPGQVLQIGDFSLELEFFEDHDSRHAHEIPASEPIKQPDSFPPNDLFSRSTIAYKDIRKSEKLSGEYDYVAIGGGLGSFTWVNHLRIFGVPVHSIKVLGIDPNAAPYGKYGRLCANSQIPGYERLRSNSPSTPDNIWGFPGYAMRETWRDLKYLKLWGMKYILQVFGEPFLFESYTPRLEDVFKSIDVEANRIGWDAMWTPGRVLKIRRLDDGRYVMAYRIPADAYEGQDRDRYIIGKFIHIATGYPASRYLPDLQQFKQEHNQSNNVVNAYEDHEEIYENLIDKGGNILIRGRGIVASRIVQRAYEVRKLNPKIRIFHLMRSTVKEAARYDLAKRGVFNDTEFQPFNWPKSCWGGTLRRRLAKASPEKRMEMLKKWGGTTTAQRSDWEDIIRTGRREGWYTTIFGDIVSLKLKNDRVVAKLKSALRADKKTEVLLDYIIDCTGLIGDIEESALLKDLIDCYKLPRNPVPGKPIGSAVSGISVANNFEIQKLRNGFGRAYASGVVTTNGPFAAVDSFLGLQFAALSSVEDLVNLKAPHIKELGPFSSFSQWLKWCFNKRI